MAAKQYHTKWPDAAPQEGEELIFSISCGNSHLHWATHTGEDDGFNPQIFWRTPHLNKKEFQEEDQIAILSRNLPDDPHDYIFGHSVEATIEGAKTQSSKRAAPLISVYVVSTNTSQEILLSKIWNSIPCCRFFVMKGDDFFKKEEGRYDTIGNDRLATLTGAVHLHGHPALVFDGGTATTYSATDCRGNIMGGGIGPGIQCKLRSLADDTSALPEITTEEVIARVNQAQEMDHPLPTFARDTQEAMMADAFQEFAFKGKNVIQQWLEKAYNQAPMQREEGMKYNDKKMVCATGGDGDILMQLLQPNFGGVIEHFNTSDGSSKSKYQVENSKHLIHYGISCVLSAQVSRKRKDSPHSTYLGKRVAKHFEVEADDGDNIFRGVVAKVIPAEEDGSFDFRIHYDDGDKEDVGLEELIEMLGMFDVHGEKKSKQKNKGRKKKPPVQRKNSNEENAKTSEKTAVKIPSFPLKSAKTKAEEVPDTKQPAAKKSKKTGADNDVKALVNSKDPRSFVRKRVAKDFDGSLFFGTVMFYDDNDHPPFWHIEYDDGDEEDYSKNDLVMGLKHYMSNEYRDANKKA